MTETQDLTLMFLVERNTEHIGVMIASIDGLIKSFVQIMERLTELETRVSAIEMARDKEANTYGQL